MSVIGSITIYRSTVLAAIQAESFLQGVLSTIKKTRYFYHVKWSNFFFLIITFDTQVGRGRLTAHDSLL